MNPIPSSEPITNLTFDELPVGARARISRTLTQDDIVAFALVSGDVNPAHVDPEYANATRFHGTIDIIAVYRVENNAGFFIHPQRRSGVNPVTLPAMVN